MTYPVINVFPTSRFLMPILVCVITPFTGMNLSRCCAEDQITFEKDIRPIFRAHCFDCHGSTEEIEGGLDLRLVRFMMLGGDSGPAIEPHQSEASLLIDRIISGEMPPGDSEVSQREISVLRAWIDQGAVTLRPEPESIAEGLGITPEEREFWAYQPIKPTSEKELQDQVPDAIVTNYLDKQFVLESMDRLSSEIDAATNDELNQHAIRQELLKGGAKLFFADEASRDTLIRRAYFDLLGLPPSTESMQRWREEKQPDWYSNMLDDLLASPHYGERWGRHWLDVAGYSDSEGYTNNDTVRPWAWRYRDWVVQSLNQDQPFDQFITEQLAGDELTGPIQEDLTDKQIKLLTATGFLRMAADGTGSGANTPEARNQVIADTIKIVGTSLLGLTLQCAQCHDHRYDPIPQKDYYATRAVFEPALNWQKWKVPNARLQSLYTRADREVAASIEQEAQVVAKKKQEALDGYMNAALTQELERQPEEKREILRDAYRTPAKDRSPEQTALLKSYPSVNITTGNLYQYIPESKTKLQEFDKEISEIRSKKPEEQFVRALTEPAEPPPETKLFHRGDHQQPKQTVNAHALQIASPVGNLQFFQSDNAEIATSGRRLAFAKWITGKDNPLFARVITNRIWMHHFGSGIVTTPGDFGQLGSRPSHPKLLDWIANEFKTNGWSLKKLHRTIMLSRLYRQQRGVRFESSNASNLAKLSSTIRAHLNNHDYSFADLIRLDAESLRDSILKVSGSLDSSLGGKPVNIKDDETGSVVVDGKSGRRSLYIQSRRTKPVSMLQTFDAPVMETNCEIRANSTVATQSLLMLNGEFVLHQASMLANRAAAEAKQTSPEMARSLPTITQPQKSQWSYGFGRFDEVSNRTENYQALTHWTGSQWQAGESLPDLERGWVLLHSTGGHPDSKSRSVVRRWTAASKGTATITGNLAHGSASGDGVRGRIVSSRIGLLGSWEIKNGSTVTSTEEITVQPDDQIDFITESMENHTSDSFNWTVSIHLIDPSHGDRVVRSDQDFSGPQEAVDQIPGQIQRAWELVYQREPSSEELAQAMEFIGRQVQNANISSDQTADKSTLRQYMTNLCQMLLSSNEFLYVE